jgi:hypothetical protein
MDLRRWLEEEHRSLWARFADGIVGLVPADRWTEHADNGGSCIAQLLFHVSLHADMALQCVVRGQGPLVDEWRAGLGLHDVEAHRGLAESEDPGVVAVIDPVTLRDYAEAVHATTAEWLATADLDGLDNVPPASERLATLGGVRLEAVPWLHRMWDGKPAWWFVQWEATGHILNHLGEMVSVRNRLGLSPF